MCAFGSRVVYFENNGQFLQILAGMTKIIATHIRNTDETFIGIFIGIPLGYIVCYHHVHY